MEITETIFDVRTNTETQVKKEYIQPQEEITWTRKVEITERLNQLSQDFIQVMAGAYFEDLETRKTEFQALHNELRELEGKPPRKYNLQQN